MHLWISKKNLVYPLLEFRISIIYEGGSKSSRKSAAKFVIVMRNLRSLCML